MATRNLSLEYAELRSLHRSNYPRGSEGLQPPPEAATAGATSVTVSSAPPWVEFKELIRQDIDQLKESLHLLQNLHAARLRINFDPESVKAQDQEIERVVDSITAALRRCEGNIKRIALAGGDPRQLQQQERQVMMNAMRAMAMELNAQSKTFRHAQKEFLDSQHTYHTNSTANHSAAAAVPSPILYPLRVPCQACASSRWRRPRSPATRPPPVARCVRWTPWWTPSWTPTRS